MSFALSLPGLGIEPSCHVSSSKICPSNTVDVTNDFHFVVAPGLGRKPSCQVSSSKIDPSNTVDVTNLDSSSPGK